MSHLGYYRKVVDHVLSGVIIVAGIPIGPKMIFCLPPLPAQIRLDLIILVILYNKALILRIDKSLGGCSNNKIEFYN